MSSRNRDTRATPHRDAQEIQQSKLPMFKSPKINLKNSVKINNAIFFCRPSETKEQAEKRLLKTFKNSIL